MPTYSLNKLPKGPRIFISLILFQSFIVQYGVSQSTIADMRRSAGEATLPVVVMPSPNAATLTRTIVENVDLYTGKLSLSIPLYTLKSRNIEVPISVNAAASAHRVNEVASWVGLGWHLNAGGMITRVMKNLPDEYNTTISPTFNFPGVGYLNLNTAAHGNVLLDKFYPAISPNTEYTITQMKDIINRGNWNTRTSPPDKGFDLQPDEFFFNFGKYSGQFVFDQAGNVKLITESNMYVVPTISGGKITKFTVLTDDGYKYEFGDYALNAVEESKLSVHSKTMLFTYRFSECFYDAPYNYPGGDGIPAFTETVRYYIYDATRWLQSYNGYVAGQSTYTAVNLMEFDHGNNNTNSEYPSYPSTWYLTKITSPTNDYVSFTYVSNGTLSYVTDRTFSSSEPVMEGLGANYGCPYLPLYFPGPFFKSLAGPKNNYNYPNSEFAHYPSTGDYTITTNTITLQSKKLKDIVTSFGHKVDFISTTSRLDLPGDKQLDKISILNNGVLVKEFLFEFENGYSAEAVETIPFAVKAPRLQFTNGIFGGTTYENQTKTHTGNISTAMRNRLYLKSITERGANQEVIPAYKFEYFNKADLPFRTSRNQDVYGYAKDATAPPVLNKQLAGVLKKATYPTGGYKEFEYEISRHATLNVWNGLRIKSIKEYELATATEIIKNYTYGTFSHQDQAVTSYTLPDIIRSFITQPVSLVVGHKAFSSESRVNPQMLTRGAAGGYTWVEVSQPNNGTFRVEFSNPTQHPNQHTASILVSSLNGGFKKDLNSIGVYYPYPEHSANDWQRGLPLFEYIKDYTGKLIQEKKYDYDFTSYAESGGKSLGLQVTKYRIDFGADWNWLVFGRYGFYPKWQFLKAQTTKEFAANGSDYRETRIDYTYDKWQYNFQTNPTNKEISFLRQTKTTNSKNEEVINRTKYPLDYTATTDAFGNGISMLKQKYTVSPVIESYFYVQNPNGTNKRYIGGTLNKYHSDKPLLLQSYSLLPSATLTSFTESAISGSSFIHDPNYKSTQHFTVYNSFGGIKQQSEESDINESYIWDYNDTYPVAKVTNAASSETAYSSFEADGKGHWTYNIVNIGQAEKGITGKKYYAIPVSGASEGFINSGTLSATQKFKLTFWAKHGHPTVSKYPVSGPATQIAVSGLTPLITVNGWRYYEIDIDNSIRVEVHKLSNAGTVYVDEVRLFPKNAQMTTYTFDPLIGMTSVCDPNNRIVYYEYDGLQRLRLLKDQYGNVTKTLDYNYKQ